jgi:hypothetical protein
MFWRRAEDQSSNTIHLTIESAWRRDYTSTYFTAALGSSGESLMKINGKQSPEVDFGDGTPVAYLEAVRVTAYSEQENWFMGEETIAHTFETPNNAGAPWVIKFSGCCRMRDMLLGQGDKEWELTALVDLLEADMSPRIVTLPVIQVLKVVASTTTNDAVSFELHTAEHDGASITWGQRGPAVPGQQVSAGGIVTLNTQATHSSCSLPGGAIGQCIPTTCPSLTSCMVTVTAYVTYASKLWVPVDLVVIMIQNNYPAFINFPLGQTGRIGFDITADIAAFQNASAASGLYVGFTVGALPPGLHLSTVRGKGINRLTDPAIMSLRWSPCTSDIGRHVVCMDAVNSEGRAATQKCLDIQVTEDEPPTLQITEVDSNKVLANNSKTSDLMMGLRYTFNITAEDANGLDTLLITPVPASPENKCSGDECLPPTAALAETVYTRTANGRAVAQRTLTFSPKHDHGGYEMVHCFSVSDSCGKTCGQDSCPGRIDVVTKCVTFKVRRCEMVVRQGQQLQQIAAIYHSDWLQLWSHNQNMLHPDMDLNPHQVLNIGHVYDVQPFDKPGDVALRFVSSFPPLFSSPCVRLL